MLLAFFENICGATSLHKFIGKIAGDLACREIPNNDEYPNSYKIKESHR